MSVLIHAAASVQMAAGGGTGITDWLTAKFTSAADLAKLAGVAAGGWFTVTTVVKKGFTLVAVLSIILVVGLFFWFINNTATVQSHVNQEVNSLGPAASVSHLPAGPLPGSLLRAGSGSWVVRT